LKVLIKIFVHDGISVDHWESMDQPERWMLMLTDPVHNHFGISDLYQDYVERAGLRLLEFKSKPGGAHGGQVGLVVGK
jgi:hypothetical protein